MSRASLYAVWLLLLLTVASVVALFSGSAMLNALLPGGLPFGNLVAACILCAPAGAATLLSPAKTPLRYFSVLALLAAIVWLPVSIALAGNLRLNFSGAGGDIWQAFTIATTIAAYVALVWALIGRLLARRSG